MLQHNSGVTCSREHFSEVAGFLSSRESSAFAPHLLARVLCHICFSTPRAPLLYLARLLLARHCSEWLISETWSPRSHSSLARVVFARLVLSFQRVFLRATLFLGWTLLDTSPSRELLRANSFLGWILAKSFVIRLSTWFSLNSQITTICIISAFFPHNFMLIITYYALHNTLYHSTLGSYYSRKPSNLGSSNFTIIFKHYYFCILQ